ncbi:unnamed protein product, partial [Chrysoparadoxa australica]
MYLSADPRLSGMAMFPCEIANDIEELRAFSDELRGGCSDAQLEEAPAPAPAISGDEVNHVLLTGVTGFIGRMMLLKLLEQREELKVTCIVRAKNNIDAFGRIRAALEETQIWESRVLDRALSRVVCLAGDLSLPYFGLEQEMFNTLCKEVHAVFHLAADVKLASSYSSLRTSNVTCLRPVLELCLTHRLKHIHFGSTMGVFPAYFCLFSNEYKGYEIGPEANPDLEDMIARFPPKLLGYPWSKLVVEQTLLHAKQKHGLPVGLYRIPQTGVYACSGFCNQRDITTVVIGAMLQERAAWEVSLVPLLAVLPCMPCKSISLGGNPKNYLNHM